MSLNRRREGKGKLITHDVDQDTEIVRGRLKEMIKENEEDKKDKKKKKFKLSSFLPFGPEPKETYADEVKEYFEKTGTYEEMNAEDLPEEE